MGTKAEGTLGREIPEGITLQSPEYQSMYSFRKKLHTRTHNPERSLFLKFIFLRIVSGESIQVVPENKKIFFFNSKEK